MFYGARENNIWAMAARSIDCRVKVNCSIVCFFFCLICLGAASQENCQKFTSLVDRDCGQASWEREAYWAVVVDSSKRFCRPTRRHPPQARAERRRRSLRRWWRGENRKGDWGSCCWRQIVDNWITLVLNLFSVFLFLFPTVFIFVVAQREKRRKVE